MTSLNDDLIVVAVTSRRNQSREWQVVLAAAGIASTVVHEEGEWRIGVTPPNVDRARAELDVYLDENLTAGSFHHGDMELQFDVTDQVEASTVDVTRPGATLGIIVFLLTIAIFHFLQFSQWIPVDWFQIGCMNAGEVQAGQWWRAVTALTLHSDAAHLLSNALFGSVFAYLASRNLGGGLAWLGIVLSGSLGNLMNGFTRAAEHTSIGVSTSVFGALGLLIAYAIHNQSSDTTAWKRWSPMMGGLILFFYLGIGDDNTDIAAHFYGLVCGILVGACLTRVPKPKLSQKETQFWSGVTALSMVAAAWSLAIVAS